MFWQDIMNLCQRNHETFNLSLIWTIYSQWVKQDHQECQSICIRPSVLDLIIRLLLGVVLPFYFSKSIERLFMISKKVAILIIAVIFNLKHTKSYKPFFTKYKIATLPCIYILKTLTYLKKNKQLFENLFNNHNYITT